MTTSSESSSMVDKFMAAVIAIGAVVLAWHTVSTRAEIAAAALEPVDFILSSDESAVGVSVGSAAATKVLIEFSDYQCPFCGEFARDVHPQIMRELVDTNDIRYVFFDYPLESIHPRAKRLATAARCAPGKDGYWRMYDLLFSQDKALATDAGLFDLVSRAKIDLAAVQNCLDSSNTVGPHKAVEQSIAIARRLGLASTPTLLGGTVAPDGSILVSRKLAGARTLANIKALVNAAE